MTSYDGEEVASGSGNGVPAFSEKWAVALLGIAESMRTAPKPKMRASMQALQSMLLLNPPHHVEAIAHFHLGKTLYFYSRNADLARSHLEKAYEMTEIAGYEEYRVQVSSFLAAIYMQQRHITQCKNVLNQALQISRSFPFWHIKLLFQMISVCIEEPDYASASSLLDHGAQVCRESQAPYTEILFYLTKIMMLLTTKDSTQLQAVSDLLGKCSEMIETLSSSGVGSGVDSLKAFFFVLQVCHLLMTGAVRSAKQCLTQLQSCMQQLSVAPDPHPLPYTTPVSVDSFEWMSKDELCILVYLVTVVHAMEGGKMQTAQKYCDKAMAQIDKLRTHVRGFQPLLTCLHTLLLENSVMNHLIVGQPSVAIQEIALLCQVANTNPLLFSKHESQAHTLLGLYAMVMRCPDLAEHQFNTALRVTKDMDLWSFVNLNLAVVYLQSGREQDFYGILERINPERLPVNCISLRAAAHYVRGLQSFFQSRIQDAKRYLKESLTDANNEDLSRISASALVLLTNIFLRSQNVQECSNMLSPALELVNAIPDLTLQIWATNLLHEVYNLCNNDTKAAEAQRLRDQYMDRLSKERHKAIESHEHALLRWTEGDPSMFYDAHSSRQV